MNLRRRILFGAGLSLAILAFPVSPSRAAILSFGSSDLTTTPVFNNVQNFDFSIEISGAIVPGGTYIDPDIVQIVYTVTGLLPNPTPSGFPGFNLIDRTIIGNDFYAQGSSLEFSVAASADLTDGLQVSELTGANPVFLFDAVEIGNTPGRYHPPLFQLNADGTGSIQNSNNNGGINPGSGELVNVNAGDEYITNLSFTPSALTLSTVTVPEPSVASLGALAGMMVALRRRR